MLNNTITPLEKMYLLNYHKSDSFIYTYLYKHSLLMVPKKQIQKMGLSSFDDYVFFIYTQHFY